MRWHGRKRTQKGAGWKDGPNSEVRTRGRGLKLMKDIRKCRKFLNFWVTEVSPKVEIPVRGRGEETGDKAIFKNRQIEETRKPRFERNRIDPGVQPKANRTATTQRKFTERDERRHNLNNSFPRAAVKGLLYISCCPKITNLPKFCCR